MRTQRLVPGPLTEVYGLNIITFRTTGVIVMHGLLDGMPRHFSHNWYVLIILPLWFGVVEGRVIVDHTAC